MNRITFIKPTSIMELAWRFLAVFLNLVEDVILLITLSMVFVDLGSLASYGKSCGFRND